MTEPAFDAEGLFDDPGNQEVLAQAARALKPGGQLVIELNNYPRLMRGYLPSAVFERDRNLVVDQHHLDPLTAEHRRMITVAGR